MKSWTKKLDQERNFTEDKYIKDESKRGEIYL